MYAQTKTQKIKKPDACSGVDKEILNENVKFEIYVEKVAKVFGKI